MRACVRACVRMRACVCMCVCVCVCVCVCGSVWKKSTVAAIADTHLCKNSSLNRIAFHIMEFILGQLHFKIRDAQHIGKTFRDISAQFI